MQWWISTLLVLAAYAAVVWGVAPRVIPLMVKRSLPARIPRQLEEAISQLERDSKTPYEYLKNASEYILSQAHGARIATITRLPLAFETDTKRLLLRRGFMHCHHLNHLLRLTLAKSRFFNDDQIVIRTTFLSGCVHQYLQVRIAGQWYDVDLWADALGIPLGKHAWGFR